MSYAQNKYAQANTKGSNINYLQSNTSESDDVYTDIYSDGHNNC